MFEIKTVKYSNDVLIPSKIKMNPLHMNINRIALWEHVFSKTKQNKQTKKNDGEKRIRKVYICKYL